ncbi:MAG: FtsX-like permease family protein, partial [Gemmatimonadaceae bacterium]
SMVAALVVGNWAGSLLRSSLIPGVRWSGSAIDLKTIGGITAATVIVTFLLALVPMAHLRRFGTTDALRNGQRATSRHSRLRATLVMGQTALAVVLLSGAMLCVESLRRVMSVHIGYDVQQVAFAIPKLKNERGGESFERTIELVRVLRETSEQLARSPNVERVALASHSPIGGFSMMTTRVFGVDSEPKLNGSGPMVRDVSPDYMTAVGLRIVSGRAFASNDVQGAPLVAVVNEAMARIAWPGKNPLGQCLTFYRTNVCRTVVGVVQDAHISSVVESATLQAFLPLEQGSKSGGPTRPAVLIVRAKSGQTPAALAQTRTLLEAALPNSDLRLQTLEQKVERDYRPWRLGAFLFGVLAALALLVASVGLYGVIAYGVRRRTHEIGIRAALGAERGRVVLMVVQGGVTTVAIGSVLGMLGAVALSRYASTLFYETSMGSPIILVGVVAVMLCTSVLASIIPAWQAGRVSPMTALRSE